MICKNYLKATGLRTFLPINVGQPGIEVKHIVKGLRHQCSSAFIGGYLEEGA